MENFNINFVNLCHKKENFSLSIEDSLQVFSKDEQNLWGKFIDFISKVFTFFRDHLCCFFFEDKEVEQRDKQIAQLGHLLDVYSSFNPDTDTTGNYTEKVHKTFSELDSKLQNLLKENMRNILKLDCKFNEQEKMENFINNILTVNAKYRNILGEAICNVLRDIQNNKSVRNN